MSLVLTVTGVLLFVAALMLVFERRLIYFPFPTLEIQPGALGLPHEDVRLIAEDGVTLHAWHLPRAGARRTVLVCNGNAGNMSHRLPRAAYPFLPPVGPLIRTRYETLAKVPKLDLPLLVLHGEGDEIVPFAQGRRVFEAAGGPKRFFAILGAGHNDTFVAGGEAYWIALREFLEGLPL